MAQATMVPVKGGDGKLARAQRFGLLDEIEAEMERFWRQPSSVGGHENLNSGGQKAER
jgi:hypothetical protein